MHEWTSLQMVRKPQPSILLAEAPDIMEKRKAMPWASVSQFLTHRTPELWHNWLVIVSGTLMWFLSIVANTVYVFLFISCLSLPQENGSPGEQGLGSAFSTVSVSGEIYSGRSADIHWTNKSLLIKENCFSLQFTTPTAAHELFLKKAFSGVFWTCFPLKNISWQPSGKWQSWNHTSHYIPGSSSNGSKIYTWSNETIKA